MINLSYQISTFNLSTMSSHLPTTVHTFRRNGKLQACEPCRKRKIRCDHDQPHCGRCKKTKQESQCYYHPAPLSRTNGDPAAPAVSINPNQRSSSMLPLPTPATCAVPNLNRTATGAISNIPSTNSPDTGRSNTSEVGYLGSTSFSEVFKASEHTSDHVWLGPLAQIKRSLRTPANYRLCSDSLTSGVQILRLISEHPNMKKTLKKFCAFRMTVVIPWITLDKAADAIISTLRDDFPTDDQRLELVENIFSNTGEPLKLDEEITADRLHETFTGPHLRWEILGIVFTYLALGTQIMEDDPNQRTFEKQDFIAQLVHASNTCVSFCDRAESLNDLLVWLYEQTTSHHNSVQLLMLRQSAWKRPLALYVLW